MSKKLFVSTTITPPIVSPYFAGRPPEYTEKLLIPELGMLGVLPVTFTPSIK
jgi:hypothetical protein